MTSAPFGAVAIQRIQGFDMGERTGAGQHLHTWVIFDQGHPPGQPPTLLYA
jgi:hypothetical protein